jgi:nucleoside 2-deoxyribosyltransferase
LESTATLIVLTAEGWTHLEQEDKPRAVSDQAFVAMSFASEMLPAWQDGIAKAVGRAGYRAFRTDTHPSIERIDVQIMAEIRRSCFVVADVTLQRPGVYFEAGYALGLGIPVYWCVREDEKEKVHFDTRQYNHIVWSSPTDLEAKLHDFIYAIAGPAGADQRRST